MKTRQLIQSLAAILAIGSITSCTTTYVIPVEKQRTTTTVRRVAPNDPPEATVFQGSQQ